MRREVWSPNPGVFVDVRFSSQFHLIANLNKIVILESMFMKFVFETFTLPLAYANSVSLYTSYHSNAFTLFMCHYS